MNKINKDSMFWIAIAILILAAVLSIKPIVMLSSIGLLVLSRTIITIYRLFIDIDDDFD